MLQFTIRELDAQLYRRNPDWKDSKSFADLRSGAVKLALAQFYRQYRDDENAWGRASTLNGAAISTGSEVVNTTISDLYRVALPTGQLSVADNTLLLYKSTTTFLKIPRASVDDIVLGTGATTDIFWENHGEILIYSKEGDFTSAGSLHYNYWRDPSVDFGAATIAARTVAPLPANTYSDGQSGIGATLTAKANAALTINGYSVVAGDVVSIEDEVIEYNNGLYTVTTVGSGAAPYVLTRVSTVIDIDPDDFDTFVDNVYSFMAT
jgi:hypothetical protein